MNKLRNWLGLLISLIALGWLVTAYDFSEMWPLLRDANYSFFIPIPGLLIANYFLRAMRWQLLFHDAAPVRLGSIFSAQMIGYLFNNLLPARGGELVKTYVLSRSEGLSKSGVLATIVVEKTADLLIAMALLSMLLFHYPLPDWARRAGLAVGAVTVLALGAIVYLRMFGASTIAALLRALRFVPARLQQWIEAVSSRFAAGLSGLFSPRQALRFLALSIVVWGFEILIMYLVARAFGIPLGAADLLLIMLMILFGTMVPSSPGYIGTYEFFGISALALLGISGGVALSFVVTLHGTIFIGTNLIGLGCMVLMWPGRVLPAADDGPYSDPPVRTAR